MEFNLNDLRVEIRSLQGEFGTDLTFQKLSQDYLESVDATEFHYLRVISLATEIKQFLADKANEPADLSDSGLSDEFYRVNSDIVKDAAPSSSDSDCDMDSRRSFNSPRQHELRLSSHLSFTV